MQTKDTYVDNVNHPSHYNKVPGIECIDVVRYFDFDCGNAIKYIWRAGEKAEQGMTRVEKEIEDYKKAIWYLQDKINTLTNTLINSR